MSKRVFQEGDVVRVKHSCSGAIEGRTYVLHGIDSDASNGLYAQTRTPHNRDDNPGCSCPSNWELVLDDNAILFNSL